MGPTQALDELMGLSTQVEEAVILGESGFVLASSGTPERGEALAAAASALLGEAAEVRPDGPAVARVEVALEHGSFLVVRERGRTAAATTVAQPTVGLVLYDLRTALRRIDEQTSA